MTRKTPEFPVIELPQGCRGRAVAKIVPRMYERRRSDIFVHFGCAGFEGGLSIIEADRNVRNPFLRDNVYLDQIRKAAEASIALACERCPLFNGAPDPAREPLPEPAEFPNVIELRKVSGDD